MSIKFKSRQRGEPGIVGGGTKKWYASTVFNQRMNLKELSVDIERICTVNRADIQAVLSALVQVIPEKLANSIIVDLGDLGTYRAQVKSQGEATEKEVTASTVIGNKVIFTPGIEIKNALKSATYQKVS